jgi:spore coat polysaccharide biosynthesis protein SpsF
MEVGQQNNKVGVIIQARMESTRLPGKVLKYLNLKEHRSILDVIVAEAMHITKNITIATSLSESNFPILDFCKNKGVEYFCGDENDVLSRFVAIQDQAQYDHIVRLTADNPFIDSKIISQTLDYHIKGNYDYTVTSKLPLGMNIEIFKGESLLKSADMRLNDSDREHVTLALKRSEEFQKGALVFSDKFQNIRVTVDTVQDYMVAILLNQISELHNIKGLALIEFVYNHESWVFQGNSQVFQKNSKESLKDEILDASNLLNSLDYFRSASILIDKLKYD